MILLAQPDEEMTAANIARSLAAKPDCQGSRNSAQLQRLLSRRFVCSGVLFVFFLSGLFRLAAFVRETYVASRFGLSRATDSYFSLQQLPLSVAAFMFGAFALAFVPAYGESNRRRGGPNWFPGLLLQGTIAGLALTAITLGISPVLLGKYLGHVDETSLATLNILSVCYLPIIYVAMWAGILNATGHALSSMTIAALPYLIMTASLIFICEVSGTNLLSLSASMAIGFWVMGLIAIYKMCRNIHPPHAIREVLWPLHFAEFRLFSKQMLASSAENVGFAANQLLMIYFFGLMGTGEVTANNYALRIGLLANSLITQPVAQFAQSRFCMEPVELLRRTLSTYFAWTLGAGTLAAAAIYVFREQIVTILYLHGRFTSDDAHSVISLIFPWLIYFLVLSVNTIAGRYLFVIQKGRRYATLMLGGYCLTNLMRVLWCGFYAYPAAIVWCAVVGEGTAMILGLRTCYRAPLGDVPPRATLAVS